MEASSSSPKPLVGNAGDFVHRSPDGRYEIRKAVMVNFPAAAIVNATTQSMSLNTANVPGAKLQFRLGGGPDMKAWLQTRLLPNGLPVGEAIASPNFDLANCRHVIHTNAPVYKGNFLSTMPFFRQQLVDCYRRCLEEAYKVGAGSIAFPCLGAGLVLGWKRKDASRLGLYTVRTWFKHPLHGEERRKRIPGPIYFLADPVGPYEHQVEAWLRAFDEIWPPIGESSLLSLEDQSRTPTMTIRAKKRQHKQNSARRGGARRGQITRIHIDNAFNDEDRQIQEREREQQHQVVKHLINRCDELVQLREEERLLIEQCNDLERQLQEERLLIERCDDLERQLQQTLLNVVERQSHDLEQLLQQSLLDEEEQQNQGLEQLLQQSLLDEEEQCQSQEPEQVQQFHPRSTLDEERAESHDAESQTEAEGSEERSPKRRRIGMRELKSLSEDSSEIEPEGRLRDRKAPHRYGSDEVE